MKRFRSEKRAIKRGHLALNATRDSNNVVHTTICHTKKRFGEPNPLNVYRQLMSYKGNPENDKAVK